MSETERLILTNQIAIMWALAGVTHSEAMARSLQNAADATHRHMDAQSSSLIDSEAIAVSVRSVTP